MTTRWRPNRKITFNRWADCDRCGLPWPERELRPQRGVNVCPECYDEPCHEDHVAQQDLKSSESRQSSPWSPDEE